MTNNDVYKQLQQRLDTYSVGFPATESGVEIEILKYLFTEEDAELFLQLSHKVETPEEIAPRVGKPVDELAEQLERMAAAGLLFRLASGDIKRYGAIPFIHGLFEFQVHRMSRELGELMERYFNEAAFEKAMSTSTPAFLRPIPVQQAVPVQHSVAAFDDAVALLRQAKQIVITDCVCRKQKNSIDQGCGKPLDVCFMFGSMGQYYLDHDMGRKITVEEGIELLKKAQEAGLVTQPGTAQNPAGMCNCCGDCCGVLRTLRKLPNPGEIVYTNHFAVVAADDCTGCETCLDRCQMDAIFINDDDVAQIKPERCIGCGLCVTTCPTEAITLEAKPADKFVEPPKTSAEQMAHMAKIRGLI